MNDPAVISAVNAPVITTAIAAKLDFKSGPCFVWTGVGTIIAPSNTGDTDLDGLSFDALAPHMVEIGENTFTMQGSNELTIVLNVPAAPEMQLANAQVFPAEYMSRTAILWRAIKLPQTDPLAAPVWIFKRIRTGAMDRLEIQADGTSHRFILTIESHSSKVTKASGQTYLNQPTYDPNDTSQAYAPSIANGDPAPTKR